jgi:hypothetical protein
MKFHVSFAASDLLGLQDTGNSSAALGIQFMHEDFMRQDRPSFFATPSELRQIADHFDQLATAAGA